MGSIALHHFPPVVWRDGGKKLWNVIHRKALKNRPEERVRLRILEYLLAAGWSKHRISTEEHVGQMGGSGMRSDIVCYDQQFNPKLLIECKAEYIPVTEKTAEQAARYNHSINAPYLMMTNGVQDYWFHIDREKHSVNRLNTIPDFLDNPATSKSLDFDYWKNRGFAGTEAATELRRWFICNSTALWMPDTATNIRYLEFNSPLSDIDLNHYFRIIPLDKNQRLALTTVSTPYGGSRFIAILNRDKRNISVTEINLDILFDEQQANTSIYSSEGVQTLDISPYWNPALNPQLRSSPEKIASHIFNMIREYSKQI